MRILGEKYKVIDTFDINMTVPDCFVAPKNKLGKGNGEAKLYVSSKETMRSFYGNEGFSVTCFLLKDDLKQYMNALKYEYYNPTFEYRGKDVMKDLWKARMDEIEQLDDIIFFTIYDQDQIEGPRGYVNSDDYAYQLIRQISLPLVSYISAMKVSPGTGTELYYWKLFVNYDQFDPENALVFNYGKGKSEETVLIPKLEKRNKEINRARIGQGKYREMLLEECMFCPITLINEEKLLVASHIKPWAASNDKEKIDPKNGLLLSSLYDRLFDQGFITFTDDKKMIVSNWLNKTNQKRIGLVNEKYYPHLPIDEKRMEYLDYHRNIVFKG